VTPSLELRRDGDIAILSIARVAKRNALDDETIRGIETFFRAVPDGVRAVVISAHGDHFSAGLDLSTLTKSPIPELLQRSQLWHRAFELIQFGSVPVIAALRFRQRVVGGRIGDPNVRGRCQLQAAADHGTVQRGIFVGGGGSVRISRLIGPHRMMDLMLTGRIYSAEEGQHAGISQYLVAAGEAETRAIALAKQIATVPPLSVFGIMHAVPRNAEADPATGYLLESLVAAIAAGDPAAQERIADFLAGRAAKVK
jgi:enoyl-CoA hydratase/carnithine racemase